MYSHEERLRAVQLYIRLDQRVGLTICQLGYPTKNSLKSWHREYVQRLELPVGYVRQVPRKPSMLCTTRVSPVRRNVSSASSCGGFASLPEALPVKVRSSVTPSSWRPAFCSNVLNRPPAAHQDTRDCR